MTAKVFIDGAVGTTGLEIRERLAGREEFALLQLSDAERKDVRSRAEALNEADEWTRNNIQTVAAQLSPSVGLSPSVLAVSLKRESYGILPISDEVIASQQRIADTFLGLGLLPKAITVSDVQRRPGS